MKKSITAKSIAFLSIYVSLIIALSFIPQTGYIIAGPIAITTIPIIIVIATYHLGFLGSLATSISFGIFSYIVSITVVPSPIADPVLLITPRIILGIIVWSIYKALGQIKLWKFILMSFLTCLFNSSLVTSFVFIVSSYNHIYKGSFYLWMTLIYINFFVEVGVAIFLSIIVYKLVIHLSEKYKQENNNKW